MNQLKIEMRKMELWLIRQRPDYLDFKRELREIKNIIKRRNKSKRYLGIFFYPVFYVTNFFRMSFGNLILAEKILLQDYNFHKTGTCLFEEIENKFYELKEKVESENEH